MMDKKTHPKHVEFYSKNKFDKLVHLVGFIIRIYHNAWSSECERSYSGITLTNRKMTLIFMTRMSDYLAEVDHGFPDIS
jgi:hypothetical protein